jgi:SPP1 family predicted phage head-tail adaptor
MLKHRLKILIPKRSQVGIANKLEYTQIATVWGKIQTLTGRERFDNNATEAEVTHIITIRYRANIRADQRFRYKDRDFRVIFNDNIMEEDKTLKIKCVEVAKKYD